MITHANNKLVTIFSLCLCLVAPIFSHAGSATWNATGTGGLWDVASNWSPATIPHGPTDIATFGSSTATFVDTSPLNDYDIEVAAIRFLPGASSYQLVNDSGQFLTLSGRGVVNESGSEQIISTESSVIFFENGSSAGKSVSY